METSDGITWRLKGSVLIACNCDYGCPCNFNALPTRGDCEGAWAWHIQDGRYGSLDLGGLTLAIAADWPRAIHQGQGEVITLIDERANEAQREALRTLASGAVGGPWGILKNTWTTVHEPRYVPFDVVVAEQRSRARAGDALELEMEPIKNPVTGAEVTPGAVLPQGFITKDPRFAASRVFRVQDHVHYDHSGQYAAVGSFEYAGP